MLELARAKAKRLLGVCEVIVMVLVVMEEMTPPRRRKGMMVIRLLANAVASGILLGQEGGRRIQIGSGVISAQAGGMKSVSS